MTKKLDLDSLMEEFNLSEEPIKEEKKKEIGAPSVKLELEPVDVNDPDKIVSETISKANLILAHVMHEIEDGNFSPRHVEVAGQILNSINNSTSLIYSNKFNIMTIKTKMEQLRLKQMEIEKLVPQNNQPGIQQNIIVTDRESILRIINNTEKKPKLLTDELIDLEEE